MCFFYMPKISSFCTWLEWARIINFKIATELFVETWLFPYNIHDTHITLDWLIFQYSSVDLSYNQHSNQKPGIKGLRNFLKNGFPRVSVIWFMGIFLWCNLASKTLRVFRMDRKKENLPRDTRETKLFDFRFGYKTVYKGWDNLFFWYYLPAQLFC